MKPMEFPNQKSEDLEQQNISGQNSAIRGGNSQSPEEVKRMTELLNSQGHTKYFTNKNTEPYNSDHAEKRLKNNPVEALIELPPSA